MIASRSVSLSLADGGMLSKNLNTYQQRRHDDYFKLCRLSELLEDTILTSDLVLSRWH